MVDAPCESQARPRIVLVDAQTAAVSSTAIRQRIAQGRPISGLVASGVEAHILKHHLYQHHSLAKGMLHEQG